jgi:hypothetical protein
MASLGEHGIEDTGEVAIAIPDEEPEPSRAVAEVHQQIAGLLGDPGSGRVDGDAQQMHAAGGMLDDDQNIEPVPQQRVDAKEVRGENAVCLGAQEFSPARPFAARGGIDTGPLQNRPHRAGRKPVAQAASSPWIRRCPHVAFSVARRSTNRRSSGAVQRPPVRRRRGWVQRRVTRSRCHRKIVAG